MTDIFFGPETNRNEQEYFYLNNEPTSTSSRLTSRKTNFAISAQCIIENLNDIVPQAIVTSPPLDFEAPKVLGERYKLEKVFLDSVVQECVLPIMSLEPQVQLSSCFM